MFLNTNIHDVDRIELRNHSPVARSGCSVSYKTVIVEITGVDGQSTRLTCYGRDSESVKIGYPEKVVKDIGSVLSSINTGGEQSKQFAREIETLKEVLGTLRLVFDRG